MHSFVRYSDFTLLSYPTLCLVIVLIMDEGRNPIFTIVYFEVILKFIILCYQSLLGYLWQYLFFVHANVLYYLFMFLYFLCTFCSYASVISMCGACFIPRECTFLFFNFLIQYYHQRDIFQMNFQQNTNTFPMTRPMASVQQQSPYMQVCQSCLEVSCCICPIPPTI